MCHFKLYIVFQYARVVYAWYVLQDPGTEANGPNILMLR